MRGLLVPGLPVAFEVEEGGCAERAEKEDGHLPLLAAEVDQSTGVREFSEAVQLKADGSSQDEDRDRDERRRAHCAAIQGVEG